MTHPKNPGPGAEAAQTEATQEESSQAESAQYASLTDYYEAKLLHQAGKLDERFHTLLGHAERAYSTESLARCYNAAFKAQKHFHDSLRTLRQLELAREAKK